MKLPVKRMIRLKVWALADIKARGEKVYAGQNSSLSSGQW
jgi:hypothetical protein